MRSHITRILFFLLIVGALIQQQPIDAAAVYVDITSYDAFRNATIGNGYDLDGKGDPPQQCWDGAALLWQQLGRWLDTGGGNGGARGTWQNRKSENAGEDFYLIYDLSEVKRGDVVVFDYNSTNFNAVDEYGVPYGHIAFADNDYDPNAGFDIYGQNQLGKAYFSVQYNVNTSSFLGAFRYKGWNQQSPVINRAVITNRTSSGYDVTVTATCISGLQEIGCYTWHSGISIADADKLYAVPINGTASFHVDFSKFGNPQNVQFYTNVEAFNTQGKGVIKSAVEVVEDLGNDFYATIKQDSSGGYLQCSGSKIVTGLLPESASDTKNAVWHFRKQLDGDYIGSYEISSEGNGGCIDIESYGVADGNGINLLEGVGNLAQRFYICRDRQKGYDRYFFNSVLAMSSLDVPGEYTDLGGTIQLWTTNYTDAQMFLIQSPDWTIEYDANGGAGAPASQTKHYRTPVSIPTTVPSRAYYSFLGWAESAAASAAAYIPGDTYSQEGNRKLYAVWERTEADILELPADLEVIGDGAFLQTDADIIVVPESVTQIGENAFGDVVIYGYEGSAAESYAHSNGLTFVPLDDDS